MCQCGLTGCKNNGLHRKKVKQKEWEKGFLGLGQGRPNKRYLRRTISVMRGFVRRQVKLALSVRRAFVFVKNQEFEKRGS